MNEETVLTLKRLNFKQVGNFFIGKIENVYFKVCETDDNKNLLLISLSLDESINKSQLFMYLDNQKNINVETYTFDNSLLSIKVKNDETSLSSFINGIADCFVQNTLKCKCEHCESSDGLAFYNTGVAPFLLCFNCFNSFNNYLEEEKNQAGHYLLGFLCSLAGAIIGSFLWILIGAIGFVASIAGAAIAYGAFKGYELAKGKKTTLGIILNIISILIAFMIAETVGLYIVCLKKFETFISIRYFFYLLSILFEDSDFIIVMIKDLGIGLIFATLGSFRTIKESINHARFNKNLSLQKIDL